MQAARGFLPVPHRCPLPTPCSDPTTVLFFFFFFFFFVLVVLVVLAVVLVVLFAVVFAVLFAVLLFTFAAARGHARSASARSRDTAPMTSLVRDVIGGATVAPLRAIRSGRTEGRRRQQGSGRLRTARGDGRTARGDGRTAGRQDGRTAGRQRTRTDGDGSGRPHRADEADAPAEEDGGVDAWTTHLKAKPAGCLLRAPRNVTEAHKATQKSGRGGTKAGASEAARENADDAVDVKNHCGVNNLELSSRRCLGPPLDRLAAGSARCLIGPPLDWAVAPLARQPIPTP